MGNKPVLLASSPRYLVFSSGWRQDDGQEMVASSQLKMIFPTRSAYEDDGTHDKGESSRIFNLNFICNSWFQLDFRRCMPIKDGFQCSTTATNIVPNKKITSSERKLC